jgi:hypothetical protein
MPRRIPEGASENAVSVTEEIPGRLLGLVEVPLSFNTYVTMLRKTTPSRSTAPIT